MKTLSRVIENSGSFTVIIGEHEIEVCGQGYDSDKSLATLLSLAPEMAELLLVMSRGCCLQQYNGDTCICYTCKARALLAKLES